MRHALDVALTHDLSDGRASRVHQLHGFLAPEPGARGTRADAQGHERWHEGWAIETQCSRRLNWRCGHSLDSRRMGQLSLADEDPPKRWRWSVRSASHRRSCGTRRARARPGAGWRRPRRVSIRRKCRTSRTSKRWKRIVLLAEGRPARGALAAEDASPFERTVADGLATVGDGHSIGARGSIRPR